MASKKRANKQPPNVKTSTVKPHAHKSVADRRSRSGLAKDLLYPLVPAVLAFAASATSLWNDFATDDLQQILGNTFIRKLSNIGYAFTTSVWAFAQGDVVFSIDSYYRPLFSALFCVNHALFGTVPFGWHLMNVLIHAGVTLLFFVLIKELTGRRTVAALASALFAVHPSHTESIAWASGVTDPVMALFLLPAFYYYVRFRKSGSARLLLLSMSLYFLALLTKETSLALPVVIAGYELLYRRKEGLPSSVVNAALRAGLFAAPTIVYLLMRFNALNSLFFVGGSRFPSSWGIKTVPLALLKYIGLMLVPVGYSYQHRTAFVTGAFQLSFFGSLALIVVIAAAVLAVRSREFKFGALWFLALLLPPLAAISQFEQEYVVQERYLYLPSMGICLMAALGIEWLSSKKPAGVRGRAVAAFLTLILIGWWGVAYAINNRVWRDTISVFQNCVAVAPDSAEAHCSLSRAYYDSGLSREAEAEALRARDLDPDLGMTYMNLSYYANNAGRLDSAIESLEQGASILAVTPLTRPSLGTIYLNLALLYVKKGDIRKAEEAYKKSIEVSPRAVAWYYAGGFYFEQRRYQEARRMYELASERMPGWFAQIHLKLGQVYDKLGDLDLARGSYQRFLRVAQPDDENRQEVQQRLKRL